MVALPWTRDRHLMVDLETLGTNANAPIVQIGAVEFIPITGEILEKHLWNISLAKQEKYSTFNGDTVEWWLKQDPQIIASLFTNPDPQHINLILKELTKINTRKTNPIHGWWASNKTYDYPILYSAFENYMVYPGIHKGKIYDIREFKLVSGYRPPNELYENSHHNALADCERQVFILKQCLDIIYD